LKAGENKNSRKAVDKGVLAYNDGVGSTDETLFDLQKQKRQKKIN